MQQSRIAAQLELPFTFEHQPNALRVCVWQIAKDPERWHAEIAGGWWVGEGATRQAAVDMVMKRFEAERYKEW